MNRSTFLAGEARRILLADHDPQVRRTIRAHLETSGFEVLEAADGNHAMEFLREDVAAVIVDLRLPDEPGLDILRDVRARFPHTPVIMISGESETPDADAIEAMRFGACQYLAKPLDLEQLLGVVRRAIRSADLLALDDSSPGPRHGASDRPQLAGFTMEQIERWALLDTLESVGGNKAAAARVLGICEKTVYNKLRRMAAQNRHA